MDPLRRGSQGSRRPARPHQLLTRQPKAASPKRSVKIITVQQRRDSLAELQAWFLARANGGWEHNQGITIETLDNPGWSVKIDLADTDLVDRPLRRHEQQRDDDDWVIAWRDANSFHAAGGPRNLAEALDLFLDCATRSA